MGFDTKGLAGSRFVAEREENTVVLEGEFQRILRKNKQKKEIEDPERKDNRVASEAQACPDKASRRKTKELGRRRRRGRGGKVF